jgi:2-keto-4-pentenoate hydratase/2-oxohepta-3-ene-1,7-dioic acid hydratase in catechol pathway
MKFATYRSGGAVRVGVVDADAGRLFDLSAAARCAGAPEAPFASMLALIDSDDAGLDLARSLVGRRGGEGDLWSDLDRVELVAPLPEPRQMRDAMSFSLHIRQSGRGARAVQALQSGGLEAFKAAMQEPLEELPAVYRGLPIYYITNRFTVVGPGATVQWPRYSKLMDYELEVGVVTRRSRSNIPAHEAGAHIFGTFSATRSSTTFPPAIARRSKCRAASGRPRARVSTAPTRSGPGS